MHGPVEVLYPDSFGLRRAQTFGEVVQLLGFGRADQTAVRLSAHPLAETASYRNRCQTYV